MSLFTPSTTPFSSPARPSASPSPSPTSTTERTWPLVPPTTAIQTAQVGTPPQIQRRGLRIEIDRVDVDEVMSEYENIAPFVPVADSLKTAGSCVVMVLAGPPMLVAIGAYTGLEWVWSQHIKGPVGALSTRLFTPLSDRPPYSRLLAYKTGANFPDARDFHDIDSSFNQALTTNKQVVSSLSFLTAGMAVLSSLRSGNLLRDGMGAALSATTISAGGTILFSTAVDGLSTARGFDDTTFQAAQKLHNLLASTGPDGAPDRILLHMLQQQDVLKRVTPTMASPMATKALTQCSEREIRLLDSYVRHHHTMPMDLCFALLTHNLTRISTEEEIIGHLGGFFPNARLPAPGAPVMVLEPLMPLPAEPLPHIDPIPPAARGFEKVESRSPPTAFNAATMWAWAWFIWRTIFGSQADAATGLVSTAATIKLFRWVVRCLPNAPKAWRERMWGALASVLHAVTGVTVLASTAALYSMFTSTTGFVELAGTQIPVSAVFSLTATAAVTLVSVQTWACVLKYLSPPNSSQKRRLRLLLSM